MTLDHYPASRAALECCETLVRQMASVEGRKYQRGQQKRHEFEGTVAAIIVDLFQAARHTRGRWSFHPLKRDAFTDEFVSFRNFQSFRTAALALELIEELPALRQWYDLEKLVVSGKTTRWRAKQSLFDFAAQWQIRPDNLSDHFRQRERPYGIVLKEGSFRMHGHKVNGKKIKFTKTTHTERLTAEVQELNAFLRQHDIEGGHHVGYQRIFNQGTREGYGWNKGGRLYSVGEGNYQLLKKPERLRMTIDGMDVVEIDVRGSYLTILHGISGAPFDTSRDPYALPGVDRRLSKAWVTMTLGHSTFHKRWPKQLVSDLREKGLDTSVHPVSDLKLRMLQHLPLLASWPEQKITSLDLMFLESQAMIGAMLQLMREYAVPSLAVHDSLIVRSTEQNLAENVLRAHYRKVCGLLPALHTRHSSSGDHES